MDLNSKDIPDYSNRHPFFPFAEFDVEALVHGLEVRTHRAPLQGVSGMFATVEITKSNTSAVEVGKKHVYRFDFTGDQWSQVYNGARLKAFCLALIPEAGEDANRARDTIIAAKENFGQYGRKVRITSHQKVKKGKDKKPVLNPDGTKAYVYEIGFLKP